MSKENIYGKYAIEIYLLEKNTATGEYPAFLRFWLIQGEYGSADESLFICGHCKSLLRASHLDNMLCPVCGVGLHNNIFDGRIITGSLESIAKTLEAQINALQKNCSLVLIRRKVNPVQLIQLSEDKQLSPAERLRLSEKIDLSREAAIYTRERLLKDLEAGASLQNLIYHFLRA